MKHTQGPWKWGSVHGALQGKHGQVIAWSAGERGSAWLASDEDEQRGNDRIVAASLACYQALRTLYDETADYIKVNHLGDVHHNQSMKAARDALALAERGQCP